MNTAARSTAPSTAGTDPDRREDLYWLKDLPVLSPDVHGLIALLTSDQANIRDITTQIERQPALAARVLGLANSAYFGLAGKVKSIHDAIRVLGLDLVRAAAIALAFSERLDTQRCQAFEGEKYWLAALLGANVARDLSLAMDAASRVPPETAWLGALLRRLGLLALVHVFPETMQAALVTRRARPDRPLCAVERDLLGFDHRDAGAWVMERWHLPQDFILVARHAHDMTWSEQGWQLARLAGIACQWADDSITNGDARLDNTLLATMGITAARGAAVVAPLARGRRPIEDLARALSAH